MSDLVSKEIKVNNVEWNERRESYSSLHQVADSARKQISYSIDTVELDNHDNNYFDKIKEYLHNAHNCKELGKSVMYYISKL